MLRSVSAWSDLYGDFESGIHAQLVEVVRDVDSSQQGKDLPHTAPCREGPNEFDSDAKPDECGHTVMAAGKGGGKDWASGGCTMAD